MNNGTIVCKRTLTKANEVLETVSLSLFPSVHHSSVFAINKQPSTTHSLLGHLFFSDSSLACQAVALAKVSHSSPEFRRERKSSVGATHLYGVERFASAWRIRA